MAKELNAIMPATEEGRALPVTAPGVVGTRSAASPLSPRETTLTDFVFSDADMDLIVRALNARADTYARVASKAGTVPDYEIASRAARRHRALAKRVRAAHTTPRTAPHPAARIAAQAALCGTAEFFVEGAPDSDGQHG